MGARPIARIFEKRNGRFWQEDQIEGIDSKRGTQKILHRRLLTKRQWPVIRDIR